MPEADRRARQAAKEKADKALQAKAKKAEERAKAQVVKEEKAQEKAQKAAIDAAAEKERKVSIPRDQKETTHWSQEEHFEHFGKLQDAHRNAFLFLLGCFVKFLNLCLPGMFLSRPICG